MVFVEIRDQQLRASLAAFLDARFAGSVFDRDTGLELDFYPPSMTPRMQLRSTERLLWAWYVALGYSTATEVWLSAWPSEDESENASSRETMKLRLGA